MTDAVKELIEAAYFIIPVATKGRVDEAGIAVERITDAIAAVRREQEFMPCKCGCKCCAHPPCGHPASIEQVLVEVATGAVVKLFREGQLVAPDYANRIKLPADLVQRIYAQIDYNKVVEIMGGQINEMVATRITRAMTEEITSDIKSVLSHQPTRERLRGVVAAELLSIKAEARAALPGVPARATFTNAISGVSPGRGVKE